MQVRSCKLITYKIIENIFGIFIQGTLQDGTELWIPTDPANSDYQEYLKTLEA